MAISIELVEAALADLAKKPKDFPYRRYSESDFAALIPEGYSLQIREEGVMLETASGYTKTKPVYWIAREGIEPPRGLGSRTASRDLDEVYIKLKTAYWKNYGKGVYKK